MGLITLSPPVSTGFSAKQEPFPSFHSEVTENPPDVMHCVRTRDKTPMRTAALVLEGLLLL